MRAILWWLVLASCGEDEPTVCDRVAESDPACVNEENLAECRAAEDECGDRVSVMESCPLQFACP